MLKCRKSELIGRKRVRRKYLDLRSGSPFGIFDVQVKRKWAGGGRGICSYELWTGETAQIVDNGHDYINRLLKQRSLV